MEPTSDIGIVIVGAAGDRGAAALQILPKLRAVEINQGINLDLVCVAEANEEARAALARKAAALLGASCSVVGLLAEAMPQALQWLENGRGERKLVVYDATPTAHHYLHLVSVLPHTAHEHIYYFGEKPLFTKPGQIEFVERNFPERMFFCELIETENPAFRAANEFIRAEGFRIQRMSFWRASCMGVAIAAGDGRRGVEGGALLDKAPHDLSVAVGLLGPRQVAHWSVSQVRTHLLALHESAFQQNTRRFLSVANEPVDDISLPARIPEQAPAGGVVSFHVDFMLEGNVAVPASFFGSWLGVQNTQPELDLSEKLARLGVDTNEWLNTEPSRLSSNPRFGYENQEVRLALLEGLLGSRKVHLLLNFLSKFEGRRFVFLLGEDGHRETLFEEKDGPAYHDKKDADFLGVFQRVIEHCAGLRAAEYVGREATLLVHKILMSALGQANEQLRGSDQGEAYEAALVAYRKYLMPVQNARVSRRSGRELP